MHVFINCNIIVTIYLSLADVSAKLVSDVERQQQSCNTTGNLTMVNAHPCYYLVND